MEEFLKNKIDNLYHSFSTLNTKAEEKGAEVKKFKDNIKETQDLKKSIEDFSNLSADFTLISRDSQIIFMELFTLIKLYKELESQGFKELENEIKDFYKKFEVFQPKTIFIVKNGNIEEKEEGSLQKERDRFKQSDYIKSLINIKG